MVKQTRLAMAGKWKSEFYYGSINDGFTKVAPYGPGVSAATKAKIASYEKKIEKGTFYEFTGPLYVQKG
jgi:basic membrane protein A